MDRANRAYEALHRLGLTRLSYAASDRQRVLSYHDVLPDGLRRASAADALTVSASVLRRQLQDIARHRRFSHILGEPGTVIVTFDDGNRNNFECARPILAELGIRAYFFVPLETALAGWLAWPSLVALWCERSAPGLKPPGLAEIVFETDTMAVLQPPEHRHRPAKRVAELGKRQVEDQTRSIGHPVKLVGFSARSVRGWIVLT